MGEENMEDLFPGSKDEKEQPEKKEWEQKLVGGYDFGEVASALQKAIRRGQEDMAMFWAFELAESGYQKFMMRRLQVIASEDVGMADPVAALLVNSMIAGMAMTNKNWQNDVRYELISHAVLYLCRAPKNRVTDAVSWLVDARRKDGWRPVVPEEALDCHTKVGIERLKQESKSGFGSPAFNKLANKQFLEVGASVKNQVVVEGRDWGMELREYLKSKGRL